MEGDKLQGSGVSEEGLRRWLGEEGLEEVTVGTSGEGSALAQGRGLLLWVGGGEGGGRGEEGVFLPGLAAVVTRGGGGGDGGV